MSGKVSMCRDVQAGLYSKPDVFGSYKQKLYTRLHIFCLILNHGILLLVCWQPSAQTLFDFFPFSHSSSKGTKYVEGREIIPWR